MKKRIIITALSVMLASSSIIPAYAAEPLPVVERTSDLYVALREWADKHVDECNEIQDARERYKYIVQLVSANLNTYKTYQPNEEAMLSAWEKEHQIGVSDYASIVVYLSGKCGLESYMTTVYGNAIVVDGRTNFMPCVYIDDVLYLTGIENIEHGDNFDDYVLMPNGKYGVSVTEDPREAYRLEQEQVKQPAEPPKFHTTIDLDKGISVIYDSDNTFIDLVLSGASTDGNGTDKYYICENAALRAVSLNELLELGYDGPY